MAKSTDSKDQKAECEKCKKLIELVFGPEKPNSLLKQIENNSEHIKMDEIEKVIVANNNLDENNKLGAGSTLPILSTKVELENVEKKSVEGTEELNTKNEQDILPSDNLLKSTTAKSHEEQLAQKMETIEEPGLVEAATPKIDGFNITPKVLGSQENILDNSLCTKIAPEEDALDEIAKKCLGSPPDKIDERILEEMQTCGMLGMGRKKPTSRRNGYNVIKPHEKETSLETRTEQSTLYFKNQQMPKSLHDYPPMQYNRMKVSQRLQDLYPEYFKNVPLGLIERGGSDEKVDGQNSPTLEQKEEKDIQLNEKNTVVEEKAKLITADNTSIDSYLQKNPSVQDKICNKIDSLEIEESTETNTTEEVKPKEIIENVQVEIEEIRVSAAETGRLGIPGNTECDPDFEDKNMKPWNQILQINEKCIEENNFSQIDENNSVACSDVKDPPNTKEWYRRDSIDRPFNNPNTAISGTLPYPETDEKALETDALNDTAISARQDPGEYFDLSNCNTAKANDDEVINPLTVHSIAAYHQYTIFTGTDEAEESEKVVFASSITPELTWPVVEHPYQAEKPELPNKMDNEISATMGPVPQLKDIEKELSLTEMLRRVRERNRLQYCRECSFKALEAEPAEASKCPPPLDKGAGKTLGPGPCKPKPKPACPPPPPPPTCPPSPCKPKDPCAKFSKTSLIGDKIKETFSLVLQVAFRPASASPSNAYRNKTNAIEPLKLIVIKEDVNRAEKLGSFLLSSCAERKKKESENEDVILARDYEPWSPIPSWPMPKTEKKEPFVCPKEGCKIIPPPRLNPPCKENPCRNLPKRNYSLIDCEHEPLYLYNTDQY